MSISEAVTELDEGLLVSAGYNGKKGVAVMKLYDTKTNRIVSWEDNTNHKPYCYTKSSIEEIKNFIRGRPEEREVMDITEETKKDLINDTAITVRKIRTSNPLAISGPNENYGSRQGQGVGLRNLMPTYECYTDETEILTDGGWKLFSVLSGTDKVATVDMTSLAMHYMAPSRIVSYDYDDAVVVIDGKFINFRVTPNHMLWFSGVNKSGNFKVTSLPAKDYDYEQLRNSYMRFKQRAESYDGNFDYKEVIGEIAIEPPNWRARHYDLSNEEKWFEFFGWWVAEGSFNGDFYVVLSLDYNDKKEQNRVIQLMTDIGLKPSIGKSGHSYNLVVSAKILRGFLERHFGRGAKNKRIPRWVLSAPKGLLAAFVQGLILGDGHLEGNKYRSYTSSSKQLADDVQEALFKLGYNAALQHYLTTKSTKVTRACNMYRVYISRKDGALSTRTRTEHYNGKVWCVTVDPYHTVVIRSKGKVVICGNSNVKYYSSYIYDRQLRVGTYYSVKAGSLIPISKEVPSGVNKSLEAILKKAKSAELIAYIKRWAEMLGQPIPTFERIALDIEVNNEKNRIPDPEHADRPVISVAFYNDKEKVVYLLQTEGHVPLEGDKPYKYQMFTSEKELLLATFRKIQEYPFLVGFNSDTFDLAYLKGRGKKLGIPDDDMPFQTTQNEVGLKNGVHIDLYRFFHNKSIQIYVYSQKYKEFTLDAIAEALLGKNKIEFDGAIGELPLEKLAEYNLNDAQLTYEFTSINNSLLMSILVTMARIANMPLNDVSRTGISSWARSSLFSDHRRIGALIPRQEELKAKGSASTTAMIKGKKYKGALVMETENKMHFNVSVLDFASLYPSIIGLHNLSYETVNCGHEECKTNLIPETTHWECKKREGITALNIGSLRELRVHHYKHLTKDKTLSPEERELYDAISQGLKVFLNASAGAIGMESFELYCLPVAESTTALGRYSIAKAIAKAKELGLLIIFSDTDSLAVVSVSPEQINMMIGWASSELGLELELDKTYRYVALSGLKKNYFGVLPNGKIDIKGLTIKKRQTPKFFKDTSGKAMEVLKKIYSPSDIEPAKIEIKALLRTMVRRIKSKDVPIEDLAFHMAMSKDVEGYQKGLPQHVRAAKLMEEAEDKETVAGEVISFVKTKGGEGVKPTSMASKEDINVDKYLEYAESMFDQMLSPFGVSFEEILGASTLDQFWA